MKKTLKPFQATTLNQVCSLPRDNFSVSGSWIITDGQEVTICNQKSGEEPTGKINLSVKKFTRLAKWFLTGETK